MPEFKSARVINLVKAIPHVGKTHGETVCCASVTYDGHWKRQFPIAYRYLSKNQQFRRWDVLEYQFTVPRRDLRIESQAVQVSTLKIVSHISNKKEQHRILNSLVVPSVEFAAKTGKSLCAIRPEIIDFRWKPKSLNQQARENANYRVFAIQGSLIDSEVIALQSCPFTFHYKYKDETGKERTGQSEDWETIATFYNWRQSYGEKDALSRMKDRFLGEYPQKGVIFAMGTVHQRPKQWLLIGVLRADRPVQTDLF